MFSKCWYLANLTGLEKTRWWNDDAGRASFSCNLSSTSSWSNVKDITKVKFKIELYLWLLKPTSTGAIADTLDFVVAEDEMEKQLVPYHAAKPALYYLD